MRDATFGQLARVSPQYICMNLADGCIRTIGDAPKAKQHLTLHGGESKEAMSAQLNAITHLNEVVNRSLRFDNPAAKSSSRIHFQHLVFTKVRARLCDVLSLMMA